MPAISQFFATLWSTVGPFVMGLLLVLVAWLVATLLRNVFSKGLKKTSLPNKLAQWNVVKTPQEGANLIDTVSKVIYYLVWVLFLPAIFEKFGLTSIAQPISNMLDSALVFIPKLLLAILIVIVGVIVARFVKGLVYNLALTINIDRLASKFTDKPVDGETHKNSLANILGTIVYVLVLIPFVIVALETLDVQTITNPVVAVLNNVLLAIPNILVAAILLAVGVLLAKFVTKLLTDILSNTGINNLTSYINEDRAKNIDLAKIISQIVGVVIILFFLVEALTALQLPVFNAIGTAIISYLPNVLSALIILGLGIIGGSMLAKFISENFGSKLIGFIAQAALGVLSVFMALDQLKFANSIVNTAFLLIIGALSVAFAISFGLGGQEFAKKRLEKLNDTIDVEVKKVEEKVRENEVESESVNVNVESNNANVNANYYDSETQVEDNRE